LNEKYENMAKVSDVAYEPSAHSICEEKKWNKIECKNPMNSLLFMNCVEFNPSNDIHWIFL
jgi:hypothetical protein